MTRCGSRGIGVIWTHCVNFDHFGVILLNFDHFDHFVVILSNFGHFVVHFDHFLTNLKSCSGRRWIGSCGE